MTDSDLRATRARWFCSLPQLAGGRAQRAEQHLDDSSVVGLHHAGLYVASLERSIAFYAEVFGLQVAEQFTLQGEKLAFLRVGAERLELIEPESESAAGLRSTGMVDHVALEVSNLEGWMERLRQRGVVLLDRTTATVPEIGARIAFCLGPDGERIELLETLTTT